MRIVATTSLPAVDRPNDDRWNATRSCQKPATYIHKSITRMRTYLQIISYWSLTLGVIYHYKENILLYKQLYPHQSVTEITLDTNRLFQPHPHLHLRRNFHLVVQTMFNWLTL